MNVYQQIEQWLSAERMVMLFMYHPYDSVQTFQHMKDLFFNSYGWPDFQNIWLKENEQNSSDQPFMILY
jgi:MarR-like DNA-binding transcriptional regulator SgrR of sgrS sRNA